MEKIQGGGVCAAKGFRANGVHCGIRKNKTKRDLALIVSDVPCAAACVYTQNLVKGAPILVTKKHVADGYARAPWSATAATPNTCNADGVEIAEGHVRPRRAVCGRPRGQTSSSPPRASSASRSRIEPIAAGMPALGGRGFAAKRTAACRPRRGIMTTDTVDKQVAYSLCAGRQGVPHRRHRQGRGHDQPQHGDHAHLRHDRRRHLPRHAPEGASPPTCRIPSNMVSVDGDTSTNDMVGAARQRPRGQRGRFRRRPGKDLADLLRRALHAVTTDALPPASRADGEGATKTARMPASAARQEQGGGPHGRQDGHQVLPLQGGHVRFARRQLGPRALRDRLRGRARRHFAKVERRFPSAAPARVAVCQRRAAAFPFRRKRPSASSPRTRSKCCIALGDGSASATAWGCDLHLRLRSRSTATYRT